MSDTLLSDRGYRLADGVCEICLELNGHRADCPHRRAESVGEIAPRVLRAAYSITDSGRRAVANPKEEEK